MKAGQMFTDALMMMVFILLCIVIALVMTSFKALASGFQPAAATVGGSDGYDDDGDFVDSDEVDNGYDDSDFVGGCQGGRSCQGNAEGLFDVTGGYPGYYLPIREPWFEMMFKGKKKVEARLNRGPAASLKAGDQITVARSRPAGDTQNHTNAPRRFVTKVQRVKHYKTIEDMVAGEGAEALFPGLTGGEKAIVAHYREFSKAVDEVELLNSSGHAFVAIEIVPLTKEEQTAAMAAMKSATAKSVKSKRNEVRRYD